MSLQQNSQTETKMEPMLVGVETCLEIVFPEKETRPSIRTWNEWKNKKYFPSVKIGRRVFLEPITVRRALLANFTIDGLSG